MPGKSQDFYREISSVRWYRGMSRIQTEACEKLLVALRDDTEQGSAFRVRRCLSHLGLHPLVESAQIKAIMGISQGSDLAFLWFLWEASYKQPRGKREDLDSTPYTVNEQLLLSGIAHLDMPSTLRALDELLPPAWQSRKPKPQSRNGVKKTTVRIRQSRQRDQGVSPYFERLVRPRPFSPKGKYRPPESKLHFPDYLQYSNPMLKIPNEHFRWFAEYQLCPQKRVIKQLLNEELNRLIIGQAPEKDAPLCETHRLIEKIMMGQREEKANEVVLHCLSQLDVPGAELKARRKSIVADLEREIECAADKIRAESQRLLREVKSIRGTECCQLCNSIVSTHRQCKRPRADLSILMLGQSNEEMVRMNQYDQNDDQVKVMLIKGIVPNRCATADCKLIKGKDLQNVQRKEKQVKLGRNRRRKSKVKANFSQTSSLKSQKSSKLTEKLEKPQENIPVVPPTITDEKLADRIPVCSRTLPCFAGKGLHSPESKTFIIRTPEGIMLDYNKVFDFPGIPEEHMPLEGPDYVDVEDKQPVIQKLCIAALNEGQSKAVKELRQDEILSPVLRAAATCAVDIVRTKLAEAKKEHNTIETKNVIKKKKDVPIDPNNKHQIEDILKAALEKLRRNPHFVLATFPDVHKLPVLLDWVADRYGKTFSQKEKDALVKSSFNIYDRVYKKEQGGQRVVSQFNRGIADLSGGVSYDNMKKLLCITRQRKRIYHQKLNELALEQSRLIWMALRGYSNLGGQIKDTFFAYMPARESDLKREYMWKSSDYRKMVLNRMQGQKDRIV
ncbi:hypothetical protein KR038_001191 [Drosophila bunnanda]|nr:hypothetical protein KR038_001191 [Drosophila bunnanda]